MSEELEDSIVQFHTEHDFKYPGKDEHLERWVLKVAASHVKSVKSIQYILVTDEELFEMNKTHLAHDTYTDILTFPYAYDPIESDIYISYDRVLENAQLHGVSTEEELVRVMSHGILHMCGFDDHSEADIAAMRAAEEQAIALWLDDE